MPVDWPQGLEPAELPHDAVEVARISTAWGIQGGMHVHPYSALPEALFSCRQWYLKAPDKNHRKPIPTAAWHGCGLLYIKQVQKHGDRIVMLARGVSDRTQAEALQGASVWIPRKSFPTPAENEYYWVDLLGLEVVNLQGFNLGRVKECLAAGPQTTMVIAPIQADPQRAVLIPFVSAYVMDVDLSNRRITVDWPWLNDEA